MIKFNNLVESFPKPKYDPWLIKAKERAHEFQAAKGADYAVVDLSGNENYQVWSKENCIEYQHKWIYCTDGSEFVAKKGKGAEHING